jgi:hypothetical protein
VHCMIDDCSNAQVYAVLDILFCPLVLKLHIFMHTSCCVLAGEELSQACADDSVCGR